MNGYSLTFGMLDWLDALLLELEANRSSVLITVLATKGSTPREPGAKMLVHTSGCAGTIGGGHLESKAIQKAREMLAIGSDEKQLSLRIPLGAALGQCCGGHVEILLEMVSYNEAAWVHDLAYTIKQGSSAVLVTPIATSIVTPIATSMAAPDVITVDATPESLSYSSKSDSVNDQPCQVSKFVLADISNGHPNTKRDICTDQLSVARLVLNDNESRSPFIKDNVIYEPLNKSLFRLYLFGAGHVGKAVVQALQPLPCEIVWIDSRAEMFDGFPVYGNIHVCGTDDPVAEVQKIDRDAFVVIMTHNHQLDYTITEHVLQHSVASYVGLIGSDTKYRRFAQRLESKGLCANKISNLICPVGVDGVTGKHPVQIALSLSAQLLQHAERKNSVQSTKPMDIR